VLDGVGVFRASLFEEFLKVVCGRPCIALAAAQDLRGMPHARAAYSLIDATIIVGRGLLAVMFVPLLAALGALLGVMDGDIEQHSPAATRGWVKLEHLDANGVVGSDTAPFLGGGAVLITDGVSSSPCRPALARTLLGVE
jgi:hypothetical protein